jgi:hypothetical protein
MEHAGRERGPLPEERLRQGGASGRRVGRPRGGPIDLSLSDGARSSGEMRLSGKSVGRSSDGAAVNPAAPPAGLGRRRRSECRGGESVVVELEQVVGGRDQSPLAAAGGAAAALEAFDRAVEP